jgi:hypothetical protein
MRSGDPKMRSGDPKIRSGDPKMRSGDPKIRSGDPKMRSGDPKMRSGDPKIRSGDLKIRSGNPKIRPGDPKIRSGDPEVTLVTVRSGNKTEKPDCGAMKTVHSVLQLNFRSFLINFTRHKNYSRTKLFHIITSRNSSLEPYKSFDSKYIAGTPELLFIYLLPGQINFVILGIDSAKPVKKVCR